MSYFKQNLLFLMLLSLTQPTLANLQCIDLFSNLQEKQILVKPADIDTQLKNNYDSHSIAAYKQLKTLLKKHGENVIDENLKENILAILKDESLSSLHITIERVLSDVNSKNYETNLVSEKIDQTFKENFLKQMTAREAQERLEDMKKGDLAFPEKIKALGGVSAQESLEFLVGKNGINDIQVNSIIGQYLKLSLKKANKKVSTFVGKFKKEPNSEERGTKKLFVSVDSETAQFLETVMGDNPNYLMHNHESRQGTLELLYRNQSITYAQNNNETTFSSIYTNTILPVVVLSSIEASNAINYFDLGTMNKKLAKYPHGFKKLNRKGEVEDTYCRVSGYGSCTHWIGEMAIGEKLVDKYSFPGDLGDDPYTNLNEAPEHDLSSGEDRKALRTKEVGTYTHFQTSRGTEKINQTDRDSRLARIVWTQGAGREQFWSMVGDKDAKALADGRWANPGWVLYTLLSATKQSRVPVVFVYRRDASTPFDQAAIDQLTDQIYAR